MMWGIGGLIATTTLSKETAMLGWKIANIGSIWVMGTFVLANACGSDMDNLRSPSERTSLGAAVISEKAAEGGLRFTGGGIHFSELELIEPSTGKNVADYGQLRPDRYRVLYAFSVDPGGVPRIPSGETRLNAGDALVVVTRRENHEMLREALIGSTHGLDT